MLLGLQGDFTSIVAAGIYGTQEQRRITIKKNWPVRSEYVSGKMNIKNTCVVDPKKKLLPFLHIKFCQNFE